MTKPFIPLPILDANVVLIDPSALSFTRLCVLTPLYDEKEPHATILSSGSTSIA